MSKENGKIKANPNSFDKIKLKDSDKKKDPDKISDNKIVAWFQKYWYYYKAPVLIVAFLLFVIIWFVYSVVTNVETDMRFSVVTKQQVSDNQLFELAAGAADYVVDIDGDGKETMVPQAIQYTKSPETEEAMAAYSQMLTMIIDETCVAFIVDDTVYDYMLGDNGLIKLSDLGLEGEEEYRIRLNGTWFLKDKTLDSDGPYYLVFKVCNEEFLDDPEVQGRYEMYINLAKDILAGEKE